MLQERAFYAEPGLHVEIYDTFTDLFSGVHAGDVAFFQALARDTGGPVLELGSGTGRVSWPLAETGVEVIGLDLSAAMREQAESKRGAMPDDVAARVRFVGGDMEAFDLTQAFGLVLSPFRGFQAMVTPEAQRRCLECVHRHLRPGGLFALDVFDPVLPWCAPEGAPPMDPTEAPNPVTGHRVRIESLTHVNDPVRQVLTETWRFTEIDAGGSVLRQEEETLTLRWTYRQEMRYLLEATDFEIIAEYSDFDRSPPAYGKEQVWIARRP